MKIFIGWDPREQIAYDVCKYSIESRSKNVDIEPLVQSYLRENNLYWRSIDERAATEFSLTRFLIPEITEFKGKVVFCDCDFLFLTDVNKLFDLFDDRYAVQVVQHDYKPLEQVKMDDKVQHLYPRKNWSSLILWNCDHPANKELTKEVVNSAKPSFLHQFKWLDDSLIGNLDHKWNWLEGWYKEPQDGKPSVVHYTRGGPWFDNYQDVDYAKEWLDELASQQYQAQFDYKYSENHI